MLQVENIDVYYDAIHALQGISFHVEAGEIVTLIGANGAGKSTTLRAVSGLVHPRAGSITFKGGDITTMPAEQIVRLGISHVPEGRKIFAPLTVRENLDMGAFTRNDRDRSRALAAAGLRQLPQAQGAHPPDRRHPLGRASSRCSPRPAGS